LQLAASSQQPATYAAYRSVDVAAASRVAGIN